MKSKARNERQREERKKCFVVCVRPQTNNNHSTKKISIKIKNQMREARVHREHGNVWLCDDDNGEKTFKAVWYVIWQWFWCVCVRGRLWLWLYKLFVNVIDETETGISHLPWQGQSFPPPLHKYKRCGGRSISSARINVSACERGRLLYSENIKFRGVQPEG